MLNIPPPRISPQAIQADFENSTIARERLKAEIADLPVRQFENDIMEAIYRNQVAIIVAEPGTGKSTQIGQILLEHGYKDIVIEEPRIMLARTLSNRVAFEMGEELNNRVGYKTALEKSSDDWKPITFCTPGYALRTRVRPGGDLPEVLVVDEAHERSIDIDVSLAIAREELKKNPNKKLVIMSATIDTEPLSKYFGGAPIIEIPGRLHKLTKQAPGESLESDIDLLVRQGRSGIVIVPGKADIERTIQKLHDQGIDAEILPLHSELTVEEQELCFSKYSRPKVIVATDIVRYGVTMPGISFVYDVGIKNEAWTTGNVEGLYKEFASQAEIIQGGNRACREGPGISIVASNYPMSARKKYPTPEIDRESLASVILRLAVDYVDISELKLIKPPTTERIAEARELLVNLGAMNKDFSVTAVGYKMANLPLSPRTSRMLVEAEKYACVGDMATIAAIVEVGDVIDRKSYAWRNLCADEEDSDLIAQLKVFQNGQFMADDTEREANGIHVRNYRRVEAVQKHILESLHGLVIEQDRTFKKDGLMKSACAGMADWICTKIPTGYMDNQGQLRQLGDTSVVRDGDLIVAQPFNLEVQLRPRKENEEKDKRKKKSEKKADSDPLPTKMLYLALGATRLNPAWLPEVAPQLAKATSVTDPVFEPAKDVAIKKVHIEVKGDHFFEVTVAATGAKASTALANWLAEATCSFKLRKDMDRDFNDVLRANQKLVNNSGLAVDKNRLINWYQQRLNGQSSIGSLKSLSAIKLSAEDMADIANS